MAGLAGNRDEAGGESGGDRSGADSQDLRAGRSEVSEVSAQRDVAERNRAAARRSGKRDSGKVAARAARRAAAGGGDRAPAGDYSLSADAAVAFRLRPLPRLRAMHGDAIPDRQRRARSLHVRAPRDRSSRRSRAS